MTGMVVPFFELAWHKRVLAGVSHPTVVTQNSTFAMLSLARIVVQLVLLEVVFQLTVRLSCSHGLPPEGGGFLKDGMSDNANIKKFSSSAYRFDFARFQSYFMNR